MYILTYYYTNCSYGAKKNIKPSHESVLMNHTGKIILGTVITRYYFSIRAQTMSKLSRLYFNII